VRACGTVISNTGNFIQTAITNGIGAITGLTGAAVNVAGQIVYQSLLTTVAIVAGNAIGGNVGMLVGTAISILGTAKPGSNFTNFDGGFSGFLHSDLGRLVVGAAITIGAAEASKIIGGLAGMAAGYLIPKAVDVLVSLYDTNSQMDPKGKESGVVQNKDSNGIVTSVTINCTSGSSVTMSPDDYAKYSSGQADFLDLVNNKGYYDEGNISTGTTTRYYDGGISVNMPSSTYNQIQTNSQALAGYKVNIVQETDGSYGFQVGDPTDPSIPKIGDDVLQKFDSDIANLKNQIDMEGISSNIAEVSDYTSLPPENNINGWESNGDSYWGGQDGNLYITPGSNVLGIVDPFSGFILNQTIGTDYATYAGSLIASADQSTLVANIGDKFQYITGGDGKGSTYQITTTPTSTTPSSSVTAQDLIDKGTQIAANFAQTYINRGISITQGLWDFTKASLGYVDPNSGSTLLADGVIPYTSSNGIASMLFPDGSNLDSLQYNQFAAQNMLGIDYSLGQDVSSLFIDTNISPSDINPKFGTLNGSIFTTALGPEFDITSDNSLTTSYDGGNTTVTVGNIGRNPITGDVWTTVGATSTDMKTGESNTLVPSGTGTVTIEPGVIETTSDKGLWQSTGTNDSGNYTWTNLVNGNRLEANDYGYYRETDSNGTLIKSGNLGTDGTTPISGQSDYQIVKTASNQLVQIGNPSSDQEQISIGAGTGTAISTGRVVVTRPIPGTTTTTSTQQLNYNGSSSVGKVTKDSSSFVQIGHNTY